MAVVSSRALRPRVSFVLLGSVAASVLMSGCATYDKAQALWRTDAVMEREDDRYRLSKTERAAKENELAKTEDIELYKPILLDDLRFPLGYDPCKDQRSSDIETANAAQAAAETALAKARANVRAAKRGSDDEADKKIAAAKAEKDFDNAVRNAEEAKREPDYSAVAGTKAYVCALKNPEARDWVQDRIIELSLSVCEKHKGNLTSNAALINTGLGVTTSALATLGAVVSGEGAKSALAGAAGFTGATQAIINQEIYQKYVGPSIVNTIEGARANALNEIMKKRRAVSQSPAPAAKAGDKTAADKTGAEKSGPADRASIVDYSANEAIRDAVDFHQRCSLTYGLSELLKASKRVEVSDDEINTKITKLREQINAVRELQKPLVNATTGEPKAETRAQYDQLASAIMSLQSQLEREVIALSAKPIR